MTRNSFSATRLERMHRILAGHVDCGSAPGLVALVSRKGETHVEALGVQSLESGAPMQRDTIFRITSMTKPITAVAAMILVEECKLRLDDPVDRLLPELADRQVLRRLESPIDDTVPANRPILTRDLLAFTSGYGLVLAPPDTYPIQQAISDLDIAGFGPPDPERVHTPDQWIEQIGTLPLVHQPGEQWLYNIGSYILGVLIERAAGMPFETFLKERIFDPLAMHDTAFSVPARKLDRLADAYSPDAGTGTLDLADAAAGSALRKSPSFPDGGAGLVSTVDDMLAFGLMLLNRGASGGRRILSRTAVELMMADQLSPEQKAASDGFVFLLGKHGWGFGGQVINRREHVGFAPGTFGWSGGYGTTWYVDPAEELITVLMTQVAMTSAQAPAIFLDFWTSAYQALGD